MADNSTYRLVTRSDFDGLACAVLLKERKLINEITFVHPKDMQDGRIPITERDITTNLPYVPGCHLAFDHHSSEIIRAGSKVPDNLILAPAAPSAARAVYEYYGGAEAFPNTSEELLEAVDKADAAQFTEDDILSPRGWVLLNFLMDARTGLGRFRDFRISNYQLMLQLIDACAEHTIDEILELPDVVERIDLYFSHEEKFKEQLMRCAVEYEPLVVADLREENPIYAGNRFVIYALFPESNVSMHVLWGKGKQNVVFAMGKSILNRTSDLDIGELTLEYGGGGHRNAGTCQVPTDRADALLPELIERVRAGG